MFKVRETSGLLSIVLHLSTTLQTTDGKAYHPSINWNENIDLLQEKSDCKSFQGQTATEPLTHKQETLVKVQEALRCSPNKGHEETMLRKLQE